MQTIYDIISWLKEAEEENAGRLTLLKASKKPIAENIAIYTNRIQLINQALGVLANAEEERETVKCQLCEHAEATRSHTFQTRDGLKEYAVCDACKHVDFMR